MKDDNGIRAGLIPKATKSKVLLTRHLSKYRFFGLIFTFFLSMFLGLVFGSMRYIFVIFSIVVFLVCTAGSPSDPRKSFGGSLIDFLRFVFHKQSYYGSGNKDCANYLREEEKKRETKKKKKVR